MSEDVKPLRLLLWRGNDQQPQEGDETVALLLRPAATQTEVVEAAAAMAWALERHMASGILGSS